MKKLAILLLATLALTGVKAVAALVDGFKGTTYYVSKSGSNGDAKSWATAKTTIQAALDLCAAGDTVIVDDGEYSETTDMTIKSTVIPTVAYLKVKTYLKSRNGKEKTHIVGAWANTAFGTGAGAHRGIYAVTGSVIEGFTVRDCATAGTDTGVNNAASNGGGVATPDGGVVYLVNCTVDNCRAGQGGGTTYGVIPINCVFSRCQGEGTIQVNYRLNTVYNTIYVGCGSGSGCLLPNVQKSVAVNCTFVGNASQVVVPNNADGVYGYLYNCLLIGNDYSEASGRMYPYNCVSSATAANDRVVIESKAEGNPNRCVSGVAKEQILSPASGDWRLVAGSAAIDAGDDAYVSPTTFTWLPAEYAVVDFYGNPRKAGACVDAGAVEAQGAGVTPATAMINLAKRYTVTANGKAMTPVRDGLWLRFDAIPGQIRIAPVLSDGETLFGFELKGCWETYATSFKGGFRFPDRGADGGIWLTPPAAGKTLTVYQQNAKAVRYVGPDAPFQTIQAAVDDLAASNCEKSVVFVAPGVYTGTGETAVVEYKTSLAIRSTEGPEKTILDGEGVRRCVYMSAYTANAQVQGFTLTGGYVSGENSGAAFCSTPNTTTGDIMTVDRIRNQLADSIISNNVSATAAGAYGGWVQRCVFTDNRQTAAAVASGKRGAVARHALLSGCVIHDNPDGVIAALAYDYAYNCTFAETTPTTFGGKSAVYRNFDRNTTAINCAQYGGYTDLPNQYITQPSGDVRETGSGAGLDAWMTTYGAGEVFADGANRDLRMLAASEALACGNGAANDADRFAVGDVEGKAIRYVDGNPVPGAHQTFVPSVRVKMTKNFAVTPAKINAVTPGEAITLTVTPDAAHRVLGWVVGGVTNASTATSITVTLPVGAEALIVEPLFSSDLYVDATSGNDENDGMTSATAKKTLAAILALATAGDTVHAAPGDYADGTMTYHGYLGDLSFASYCPARAVVTNGVTLVATAGRDETFITGVGPQGETAVRCAVVLAGGRLVGFTLRDGATRATTGTERNDNAGGGVLAPWPSDGGNGYGETPAVIEDCTIRGCKARTAGGVYGGVLRKCLLEGNSCTSGGACLEHARAEQCVILNTVANTSLRMPHGIYSSTLVALGKSCSGSNVDLVSYKGAYPIVNSVLLTRNASNADTLKHLTNVVWRVGEGKLTLDAATCTNVVEVASAEAAGLDESGRPTSCAAATVDAGATALLAEMADGETDYDGAPRVSNGGAVDIGAYEYDWRPDYAKALLKRRFAVTAADAAVTMGATGETVEIPEGELTAVWTHQNRGDLTVPVEVTGNGTLTVSKNGAVVATVTAASGLTTLKFAPEGESVVLTFAYVPGANDTGVAILRAMSNVCGTLIIFR